MTSFVKKVINMELLPVKAHYFFLNAGQACYFNYLAVVGSQAGVSTNAVANVMAAAPFLAAVFKAVAGVISDKTRNITGVIIASEIALLLVCWGMCSSPLLATQNVEVKNTSWDSCPKRFSPENFSPRSECFLSCGGDDAKLFDINTATNCTSNCDVSCSSVIAHAGNDAVIMYAISTMLAFAFGSVLYSVSDAACYGVLGPDRAHRFGQQRLWGTLSWGLTSPLIGFWIDHIPDSSLHKYLPAAIGLSVILLFNVVVLVWAPKFLAPASSDNFFENLKVIYKDIRVIVFTLWSFIGGVMIGVMWSYAVWLLNEIKAPHILIGLTFSMQSLVIEIPMFFLSGFILKRVGHFGCMAASFVCLGIKLLGYSYLQNPWFALLIDVSGGAVFPLFYTALTGFANISALDGTANTMQCLFGAIYEGLGVSVGNFLCGHLISKFGVRIAFRSFGVVALLCAPLCWMSMFVGRQRHSTYSAAAVAEPHVKIDYNENVA